MKIFLMLAAMFLSTAAVASTEYVLVRDTVTAGTSNSMKTGRPLDDIATVTETNGKCGYKDDGLGGHENDTDYTGTAYGSYHILVGQNNWTADRQIEIWVMGESIGNRAKFSSFTLLSANGTCTEDIGGVTVTFKKYSVTCDTCAA